MTTQFELQGKSFNISESWFANLCTTYHSNSNLVNYPELVRIENNKYNFRYSLINSYVKSKSLLSYGLPSSSYDIEPLSKKPKLLYYK